MCISKRKEGGIVYKKGFSKKIPEKFLDILKYDLM